MKRRTDTDPCYRMEPDLREIPPRFIETDEGKYVIYLSDFYDFDTPTDETAEVEKEVLIALLRSKRLEKRIEICDYRHRVPFHFDENETAALEGIYVESAEETCLHQIENAALYHALRSLQPSQRRRCELYYFERLSLEEIALLENVTPKAVRFCIDRALVQLRKMLADYYE